MHSSQADPPACVQKAIDLVKEATELDKAEKFPEAMKSYQSAIEYFMLAVKCASPHHYHVACSPHGRREKQEDAGGDPSQDH